MCPKIHVRLADFVLLRDHALYQTCQSCIFSVCGLGFPKLAGPMVQVSAKKQVTARRRKASIAAMARPRPGLVLTRPAPSRDRPSPGAGPLAAPREGGGPVGPQAPARPGLVLARAGAVPVWAQAQGPGGDGGGVAQGPGGGGPRAQGSMGPAPGALYMGVILFPCGLSFPWKEGECAI